MLIQELTIDTNSIQETRFFYHNKLGFDIISESKKSISFKTGHSILHFKHIEKPNPFYHFAFTITEDNLDDSLEYIQNQNIQILPYQGSYVIPFDDWNAKSFYFHDNNGSILEFIIRYNLKKVSNNTFSKSSVIGISEIGIVTSSVVTVVKELDKLGINYYANGPKREDFSALGDDNGLLLICAERRGWLPTNQEAEQHPVKVLTNKGLIQYNNHQ